MHSHAWYVFARGAPCSPILRIAQLGIPQQLISVRFGKGDNFPDRFGSDMQKYRFNIGRFGLLFGTDYIGSYCLEGPNRILPYFPFPLLLLADVSVALDQRYHLPIRDARKGVAESGVPT